MTTLGRAGQWADPDPNPPPKQTRG